MIRFATVLLLATGLAASAFAADNYNYPYTDPYLATVLGTPIDSKPMCRKPFR